MKVKYFIAISILLCAVFVRGYLFINESKIKVPRGQETTFEFSLKSEPRITEKWQVIRVGDAQIYTPIFPRYQYGEKLRVTGKVDENGRIFRPEVNRLGYSISVYAQMQNIRGLIASRMESLLPRKEAALLVGSVLGVEDLGAEFKEELIKTGTIHVVVVSGQNLAIVAGFFVASATFIGKRKAYLLSLLFVVLYAALTGFAPPVLRACLMVAMATMALLFGREVNALWSLLISALLIVFLWPQALGEISFQLTFAASLGIITLGKWITARGPVSSFPPASARSKLKTNGKQKENLELRAVVSPSRTATPRDLSSPAWVTRNLAKIAAVPISAYIFTAPLIFYYFGEVSLVAPVVNILVAELVVPIMVLGFIVAGLALVWMPLAQLVAYLAFVPAWAFVQIVAFFSALI